MKQKEFILKFQKMTKRTDRLNLFIFILSIHGQIMASFHVRTSELNILKTLATRKSASFD
jgi:hypothetical protein